MKLDEQRQWYEDWHGAGDSDLPVERLKQAMRLVSISHCFTDIQAKTMLVIGCGNGYELDLIGSEKLVAFDLAYTAVMNAKKRVPSGLYVQASSMDLPFQGNSFDAILTSEVIEHILEPERMMREIVRILKPGGSVIISTPNWMSFFGLARKLGEWILGRPVTSDDQPVDNWSTQQSLKALIEFSGLSVTQQRGAWYFPPTGLGHRRLPDKFMARFYNLFLPLEKWMQSALPGWGHLLIMVATLPESYE